jgi:Protein of unknown function (DUF3828)
MTFFRGILLFIPQQVDLVKKFRNRILGAGETLAHIAMRTSLCFKLAALIAVLGISSRCFPQAESEDNEESAKHFVASLYVRYGPDGHPFSLSGENANEAFDPSFIALVKADAAAVRQGRVGVLDYDPLCDCQQTDATFPNLEIKVDLVGADRAMATVTFNDVGQKQIKIVLTLMMENNGWRIYNVEDFSGPGPHTDLRTLLNGEIQKKSGKHTSQSRPK